MYFWAVADLIENGPPFQKMPGIRVAEIVEGRMEHPARGMTGRLTVRWRGLVVLPFQSKKTENALHTPHIISYEKRPFLMHANL